MLERAFVCLAVLCVPSIAAAGLAAPCGDPKTQAGYFLSVIRDIARDGDLTDPKPIQTILETKFDMHPVTLGEQAGHRVDYSSHSLFGHPAEVTYSVIDEPRLQKHAGLRATLEIRLDPGWFALAPATVNSCLGGDKGRRVPMPDGVSWVKSIPRGPDTPGKIGVTWSASGDAERVRAVSISLEP